MKHNYCKPTTEMLYFRGGDICVHPLYREPDPGTNNPDSQGAGTSQFNPSSPNQ